MLPSLRELRHVGLAVTVHKYEGALQTALDKMQRKWQTLYDEEEAAAGITGRQHFLWLTSWFECIRCKAHDVHGAVKWSVPAYCQDKLCMRSAYIVVESCRHGYSSLVARAGE